MKNNDSCNCAAKKVVIGVSVGLLVGVAVGVCVGMIFAPQSGEETVKQLTNTANKTIDDMKKRKDIVIEKIMNKKESVPED